MAQYIVTGKLGAGKTLLTVGKIQEYLLAKKNVACNFDLNLKILTGIKSKNDVCYRLPDQPDFDDLYNIGLGSDKRGEENHGMLVLDECALFLNTRDYAQSGRKKLIEFMTHMRKRRWDVFFVIQHVEILDKQIRNIMAEHIVTVQRFDRIKIPFITFLFSIFSINVRFPRLHRGLVKYGSGATAPTVDTWYVRGTTLYDAYDTEQSFSSEYSSELYQLLPPYLTHGRYLPKHYKIKKLMEKLKNAKDYKIRSFRAFFLSGILTGAASSTYAYMSLSKPAEVSPKIEVKESKKHVKASKLFNDVYINGYFKQGSNVEYYFIKGDRSFNPKNLGLTVRWINPCRASVVDLRTSVSQIVTCNPLGDSNDVRAVKKDIPQISVFGGSVEPTKEGESEPSPQYDL